MVAQFEQVAILRWTNERFMKLFTGTDLLPFWYWTLGAKVGGGVVMGNVDLIEDPHLVTLGDGAALADYVALETVYEPGNGYSISRRVCVGKDCVVGVRVVVSPGVDMGERTLIMPHSSVRPGVVDGGAVMAGVPASKVLDLTSLPSGVAAYANTGATPYSPDACLPRRFAKQLMQILVIPLASAFINLLLVITAAYPSTLFLFWGMAQRGLGWSVPVAQATLPIVYLGFSLCFVIVVVAQKWVMRWRTAQGSSMVLRGVYYHARAHAMVLQTYASIITMDAIRGSVFAPLYLRLLGSKVHPTAYVDTLLITEPDLLVVGKRAIIDCDAAIIGNVIEDRRLHMGMVKVEGAARLGVASTTLRDCTVSRAAELADAALLPPSQSIRPGGLRLGADVKTDLYDNDGDDEESAVLHESLVTVAIRV